MSGLQGVTPVVFLPVSFVAVGVALLLVAAWTDFRVRRIPDVCAGAMALLGVAYKLQSGWYTAAFSVITALLLFFLLFIAFVRGYVGGGDVKLASAVALWLSPPQCYVFLVVSAFFGGGMALMYLAARSAMPLPPTCVNKEAVTKEGEGVFQAEFRRMRAGAPLPYGVALAVGGSYALIGSLGG